MRGGSHTAGHRGRVARKSRPKLRDLREGLQVLLRRRLRRHGHALRAPGQLCGRRFLVLLDAREAEAR
eukprot:7284128-Alexandrium_andersonii.AAC.1